MINLGIITKHQSFGVWCEELSGQVTAEQRGGAATPPVTDDTGVKRYTVTNLHFNWI